MKKFALSILLLIIVAVSMQASISQEAIKESVQYYNNGDYSNAIRSYEIMLADGFYNPDIYYNLANSYLKNDDIGRASLNFERALRLAPRDKDIRHSRALISKLVNEPKQNFAENTISQIKLTASLNELTVITVILFIISGIFFSLYCFFYKKVLLKMTILFSVICICFGSLLYVKVKDEFFLQEAVVIYSTQVRNNPIKTEESAFEVLAGRKIIILSELGRWVNIRLSVDGLSGWVDKNSIEKI